MIVIPNKTLTATAVEGGFTVDFDEAVTGVVIEQVIDIESLFVEEMEIKSYIEDVTIESLL